jgi:hypothetical protein
MKLFQMLIFTAVMFSNVHWQWTPNGYLASLIGAGVTYVATVAVVWLSDALRGLRLRKAEARPSIRSAGQQRLRQGGYAVARRR